EYIRREVTVAGEVGKVVIPYRIEDARPKGALRVRLSDLHWIDGFNTPDNAFDELICTLVPEDERSGESALSTSTVGAEAVPALEVAQYAPPSLDRRTSSVHDIKSGTAGPLERKRRGRWLLTASGLALACIGGIVVAWPMLSLHDQPSADQ